MKGLSKGRYDETFAGEDADSVDFTSTIVTSFKAWVFWSSLVECLTQD